jgi:ABC-2 type transport system permease protein
MRGALAQEWIRLRTLRSTWWLSAASLLVTTMLAVAFTLTAGTSTAARLGVRHGAGSPAVLGDQASFALVLSSAMQMTTLLVGLLGVFAFGHEYRHGTILPMLTSVPRRRSLAAAKLLGVALWAAVVAVLCIAMSALVLLVIGRGRFAPGVGFADGRTARVVGGTIILVVLFSLVGLGLGWLLRNVPAAVSLLFVLPVAVEPILRVLLSVNALHSLAGAGRFLPFTAGGQLVAYTTRVDPSVPEAFRNDLSPLAGGLTFAAVVAVLLIISAVLFQRRDA